VCAKVFSSRRKYIFERTNWMIFTKIDHNLAKI